MSDARLQFLKRAASAPGGTVNDQARCLIERGRTGDLRAARLELAAYCGDEASRIAAGWPEGVRSGMGRVASESARANPDAVWNPTQHNRVFPNETKIPEGRGWSWPSVQTWAEVVSKVLIKEVGPEDRLVLAIVLAVAWIRQAEWEVLEVGPGSAVLIEDSRAALTAGQAWCDDPTPARMEAWRKASDRVSVFKWVPLSCYAHQNTDLLRHAQAAIAIPVMQHNERALAPYRAAVRAVVIKWALQ